MARTAKIILDGKEYEVHAFNIRELQEVGELLGNGAANAPMLSGMKILSIALRRADPKIENADDIEPTVQELNDATTTILKLSGIEASPQTAAPAGN